MRLQKKVSVKILCLITLWTEPVTCGQYLFASGFVEYAHHILKSRKDKIDSKSSLQNCSINGVRQSSFSIDH